MLKKHKTKRRLVDKGPEQETRRPVFPRGGPLPRGGTCENRIEGCPAKKNHGDGSKRRSKTGAHGKGEPGKDEGPKHGPT